MSKRFAQIMRHLHPQLFGLIAVTSLTIALGQRFYSQPQLAIGKMAPQTIIAPANASVEDAEATEAKQQQARKDVNRFVMIDPQVQSATQQKLHRLFDQGNRIRKLAGALPYLKPADLPIAVQQSLRKWSDAEWQAVQTDILKQSKAIGPNSQRLKQLQLTAVKDPNQQKVIQAIQTYLRRQTSADFSPFLRTVQESRQAYKTAISALQDATFVDSKLQFDPALLDWSDPTWKQIQTTISKIADRMLAQGIAQGLPDEALQQAIDLQVQGSLPTNTQTTAKNLLKLSLQPNLVPDLARIQATADKNANEVPPQMVTIRKDAVIVYGGSKIERSQFLLLEYFGLSERRTNWIGLCMFGGGVAVVVLVFSRLMPSLTEQWRRRDDGLVLLLALSTPLLLMLKIPVPNLSMIGILSSTFYGAPAAILLTAGLGGLLPVGMVLGIKQWLPSLLGGLLAAMLAGKLRSREEQALLGLMIGLLQGTTYGLLGILTGGFSYALVTEMGLQALVGVIWSIVAIGLSPYLEQFFDLAPTIRLLELANPNRPLLKRLAAEAPGTFQHTIFVANLAEAAARELGCNVELVRTGTLYHDIGKMHDPLGFIENQMGGTNKHDVIDDPWESAKIIKKHVTEGIVMAKKARLPKAVQAFIPEHQGTMSIAYFHYRAQQRAQQDGSKVVKDVDFCYDGPAPQSRETGIVMLADSCEAALRSLKDATPDIANNMIQKILRARWQDGQLANSSLSREDLTKIGQVFLQVWQQSNHQRISYPK
ncbi:HDIG domain-containing metalloprotein [Alkalinema sp. FACHB-956]|uniref:HD family phosphohydrolase n=1 Tax=Alkalinema sp. FACHB-956 TaxID=2692768 RepID=UPI0016826477|nr:HDIG domain-containing metalloprotein [Alkalinema sp. FACHB-956]MBD2327758.1 HDIG domain-containing protein [Alkalinema sp. FACHB-956]